MLKFSLFAATALANSLAGAALAQTPPAQIRAINDAEGTVRATQGEGNARPVLR